MTRKPDQALGVSVQTGWAACVVVGGTLKKPAIVANERIQILGDDERFCFHMAAEMRRSEAEKWLSRLRKKALANARKALAPIVAQAKACAIVAKTGDPGPLDVALAAHPRIHTAEGCFNRDVLRDACAIPVTIVPPASLDDSRVGKLRRRRGDATRGSPLLPHGPSSDGRANVLPRPTPRRLRAGVRTSSPPRLPA